MKKPQLEAMERVSLGIIAVLNKEHKILGGGEMIYAIMVGAAGAVQCMTPAGMSAAEHTEFASKAGLMLTDEIIKMRAIDGR